MSAFDPKRISCHGAKARICLGLSHRREPPGGDMQRRGENQQHVKRRRTTKNKARKAPTSTRPHTLNAEERHRLVIDAVAEGIYEWSTETNHLELSPRLNEILGFKEGELTSASWLEHVHPDDRSRYRDATVAYFKGVAPHFVCEYRVLNKSGQWRWVSDRASSIRDADGRVLRLVGAITDVTDLKQKEAQLQEALGQQTATADALRVISRSNFELQTVLDTLVESATRLCDADHAWLFQREGEHFRWRASFGHATNVHECIKDFFKTRPVLADRGSATGRAALEGKVVHIPDVLLDAEYTYGEAQKIAGYRAALGVPLLRQQDVIGVIFVAKISPQPFTEKQIELVTTFADQAVIAIENSRLFSELRESLQQQTTTADVLKVISRSAFDLQAVLDTLVESAARLCRADRSAIRLVRDNFYHYGASFGFLDDHKERMKREPLKPGQGSIVGRVVLEGKSVHVIDGQADPDPNVASRSRSGNVRTVLGVPLLREGTPIGVLLLQRSIVQPFTDKQIDLATTFADQAVIAIENVRLLEAEQQRTRELSESLERQTATSEVLKVISRSPGKLEPVFDAMLANATRICEATYGAMWLREDGKLCKGAFYGTLPAGLSQLWKDGSAISSDSDVPVARAVRSGKPVIVSDLKDDVGYREGHPLAVAAVELGGIRTLIAVPMLKEGEHVGAITIFRREVRRFTEKQIELVQNFAAQAVIAVENTRLLTELRESLQQQTATADVLKVISRSTFDLESVLNTLTASAAGLCKADKGAIFQKDGDVYRLAAHFGFSPEEEQQAKQYAHEQPLGPGRGSLVGRVALDGRVVHIKDVLADPDYHANVYQKAFSFRTDLGVPLLREGSVIGVFALMRTEVNAFSEKEIDLVATFADQAVIAIENARLLNELRESLQQQTATADVLKVISRSTFDLRTVLQTLIESAARLCDADKGNITREK